MGTGSEKIFLKRDGNGQQVCENKAQIFLSAGK
jgi:hypothetical protein